MYKHIEEGVKKYLKENPVPWHMPGHKRKDINSFLDPILQLDMTEVPGVDDLHHPETIIRASMENMKKVYGTYASYYLVNGATCGIHVAIAACKDLGSRLVVARNCHKSVINGAMLSGLEPVFIEPEKLSGGELPDIYGQISTDRLRDILQQEKDVCAVVITSPTYEGVISDIEAISKVTREFGVKLIVDEAHGAHLPFMKELGVSAVEKGGDIVVQSLHKTMPAMTQTALLHNNAPELDEKIRKYLSVFMTTSPSYIMLMSMEEAIAFGCENNHGEYIRCLENFRQRTDDLEVLRVLKREDVLKAGAFDYDNSRIVITTSHNFSENKQFVITGEAIVKLLMEQGNVVVEMAAADYVVLISTAMDTKEDFEYLYDTLKKADEVFKKALDEGNIFDIDYVISGEGIEELQDNELCKLIGEEAKDNIYVYPPGNYIITKGEVYTEDTIEKIREYTLSGKKVYGRM